MKTDAYIEDGVRKLVFTYPCTLFRRFFKLPLKETYVSMGGSWFFVDDSGTLVPVWEINNTMFYLKWAQTMDRQTLNQRLKA